MLGQLCINRPGQLILEQANLTRLDPDVLGTIFEVFGGGCWRGLGRLSEASGHAADSVRCGHPELAAIRALMPMCGRFGGARPAHWVAGVPTAHYVAQEAFAPAWPVSTTVTSSATASTATAARSTRPARPLGRSMATNSANAQPVADHRSRRA